jgi:phosphoglycolate phosphatase-like HAD superfamily hydrolase
MIARAMRPALLLVCLACAACDRSDSSAKPSTPIPAPGPAAIATLTDVPGVPELRTCSGSASRATTGRGFDHKRSHLVAAASPRHAVQDAFAIPGGTVELSGKFAYGDMGKDLEDESIEVLLDDCTALAVRGTAKTDDDGIARIEVTAPDRPGVYDVQFWVVGDGSIGKATLHVLPKGTELVVFDIDGTLTVDDAEVTRDVLDEHFRHIADGKYAAAAYDHGAELAQTWADRGYVVVYVTGRPYWLVDHSRAWLAGGKYPPGIVRTTLRHREVVPNEDGVGAFKRAFLQSLVDAGYRIAAAHGNAKTDVWAYAKVGIPTDRTFIIGPHAGEGGTVAVTDSWAKILEIAKAAPLAKQPFVRR